MLGHHNGLFMTANSTHVKQADASIAFLLSLHTCSFSCPWVRPLSGFSTRELCKILLTITISSLEPNRIGALSSRRGATAVVSLGLCFAACWEPSFCGALSCSKCRHAVVMLGLCTLGLCMLGPCMLGLCMLGLCMLGLCMLVLCMLGLCMLGLCMLGLCMLGLCMLGLCILGLCMLGLCMLGPCMVAGQQCVFGVAHGRSCSGSGGAVIALHGVPIIIQVQISVVEVVWCW